MKYEITQESFIQDVPYAAGSIFDDLSGRHVPGPHWKPMDDEAKARAKECGIKFTGAIPDVVVDMTVQLDKDMAARRAAEAGNTPAAVGAAVADALADAGIGSGSKGKRASAPVKNEV